MSKHHAVKHARQVNQLVIEHKRAGRTFEANTCKRLRGEWLAIARAA